MFQGGRWQSKWRTTERTSSNMFILFSKVTEDPLGLMLQGEEGEDLLR